MSNRFAPHPVISGRPDIGPMARTATIGCPERGFWRRRLAFSGHPAIGVLAKAFTCGTPATGDRTSVSTAALTTALDTPESALWAGNGAAESSPTTAR